MLPAPGGAMRTCVSVPPGVMVDASVRRTRRAVSPVRSTMSRWSRDSRRASLRIMRGPPRGRCRRRRRDGSGRAGDGPRRSSGCRGGRRGGGGGGEGGGGGAGGEGGRRGGEGGEGEGRPGGRGAGAGGGRRGGGGGRGWGGGGGGRAGGGGGANSGQQTDQNAVVD